VNRFVLSPLLVGLFGSAAAAQPTIFIVRHAEKAESAGTDRFPDRSRALA
jgi:hypothetical protein